MAEIRRAPPKCIINPVNNGINYQPQLWWVYRISWTIGSIRGLTDQPEFRYWSNGEKRMRWLILGYLKLWSISLVSAYNIITWWLQRLFGIAHVWKIAEDLCFFDFYVEIWCLFLILQNRNNQPKQRRLSSCPYSYESTFWWRTSQKLPQFLPTKAWTFK